MLIIDINLLRTVTKYDPAGRLRPGHSSPIVPQPRGMWCFLVDKTNGALRRLSPSSVRIRNSISVKAANPTL